MTEYRPPAPPRIPKYATIILDRTPQEKHHNTLGQAKNAVLGYGRGRGVRLLERIGGVYTGRSVYSRPVRGGTIWELQDNGEYKLLYDVSPDSPDYLIPWQDRYKDYVPEGADDLDCELHDSPLRRDGGG